MHCVIGKSQLYFACVVAALLLGGCGKVPTWGELTGKSDSADGSDKATKAKDQPTQVADSNGESPSTPGQTSPNGLQEGSTQASQALSPMLAALQRHYGSLEQCQYVQLPGGQQTASTFADLKKLPNLRSLNANGCTLDSDAIKALGQLTSLVNLNLGGAKFNPLDLEFLKGLERLRFLDMANTAIQDQHLSLIRHIPLDGLRVTNTQVKGYWFANQKGADKWFGGGLKMIDANLTPFSTAGFVYTKGSKELEVLCVVDTAATDVQMTGLQGCDNLRVLTIRGCAVTDVGTKVLAKLPNLESIDLSGNRQITEFTLNSLTRHKKLVEMVPSKSFSEQTLQVFKSKYQKEIVFTETLREASYYTDIRGLWAQEAPTWN